MAINIFQGGKTPNNSKVNSASNSQRAKQAKEALKSVGDAVVSNAGTTAVKSSGTLGKVGSFIGKAASVASKFLPGVAGTVSKGLANIFNDPEWWQQVPGDMLTANTPLRDVTIGPIKSLDSGTIVLEAPHQARASLLQFIHGSYSADRTSIATSLYLTDNQVTQYLMPEIRKVVNAVPLQTARDYRVVVAVNTTIYAIWRQLKKWDYALKHGTTYLSNWNDPAFPILQTVNASWLQATINRLEEYLRSSVRLPHTMCEYVAWRFGRMYRSNDSAKAALVSYDVLSVTQTTSTFDTYIGLLMSVVSGSTALQQAQTDLYNAYYDHDFMVEIADDTQFKYDKKEFLLRINLDTGFRAEFDKTTGQFDLNFSGKADNGAPEGDLIITDSNLDNPTTFMSSTVSTLSTDDSGEYSVVFPVMAVNIYISGLPALSGSPTYPCSLVAGSPAFQPGDLPIKVLGGVDNMSMAMLSPLWAVGSVQGVVIAPKLNVGDYDSYGVYGILYFSMLCKSVDYYNAGLYVPMLLSDPGRGQLQDPIYYDVTTLSIDAGTPTDRTVGVEQIYAVANLVSMSRKNSTSYKAAEKLVARDTANLVESLDVSAVKS